MNNKSITFFIAINLINNSVNFPDYKYLYSKKFTELPSRQHLKELVGSEVLNREREPAPLAILVAYFSKKVKGK